MVEIDFSYFSPSFHFCYSSLPFSPPFMSFSLFVFFFSSFHIFFSFSSSYFLLFAYYKFLEKKKITLEDFTQNKDMEEVLMFEESIQISKVYYEGIFVCRGNCEEDGWMCLSLGSVIIISEAEILGV